MIVCLALNTAVVNTSCAAQPVRASETTRGAPEQSGFVGPGPWGGGLDLARGLRHEGKP